MSNEYFRQQLFQASSIHGGLEQGMMTPSSVQKTEQDSKFSEKLDAIIKEAVAKNFIKQDDPLFPALMNFFLREAHTPEGKERAIRMALATAVFLQKEFTFEKRK